MANIYIRPFGRTISYLHALRVADHSDDGELLLEERRRTEGCYSLWAEYRYSVRGIRVIGDGHLRSIGTE